MKKVFDLIFTFVTSSVGVSMQIASAAYVSLKGDSDKNYQMFVSLIVFGVFFILLEMLKALRNISKKLELK